MIESEPARSLLSSYDTERLKTLSVWSCFADEDLGFRPAARARTPLEHLVHQCVSEDTWMRTMLGISTSLPVLPESEDRLSFIRHYAKASEARRLLLGEKDASWWAGPETFFDATRSRAWIFLRRLTHSAPRHGPKICRGGAAGDQRSRARGS